MQNTEIARRLEEVAGLLNEQEANPYRVQAYRHAAEMLRRLDRPVTEKLSQNSKNAEKSALFMGAKGQLLTKFRARYVGGHATQTLSFRCH